MSDDLTIGELGRQCNLSRATLLYYDRLGLLPPADRTGANYRVYGPADAERLKRICFFRSMGIPLKEIAHLLTQTENAGPTAAILQRRLESLEREIAQRQQQQREIVRLLEQLAVSKVSSKRSPDKRPKAGTFAAAANTLKSKENAMVNKERWIEIMHAAGFTDKAMHQWHRSFETMEPQAHQEFLESLAIPAEEITKIRQWSKSASPA
jgi:DNA-binding transcriptional MerR regulator